MESEYDAEAVMRARGFANWVRAHPELNPILALEPAATRFVWIGSAAIVASSALWQMDMMLLRLASGLCVLVPPALLFSLRARLREALAGYAAATIARNSSG